MELNDSLHESGWSLPEGLLMELTTYEKSFVENEFTGLRTLNYYKSRLAFLGLSDDGRVLDAGCGMGQWSVALAESNARVDGIDPNAVRVRIGRQLVEAHGLTSRVFLGGGYVERLDFPDESFDAVFCYGVFMFTNMPRALSEFYRVLKPGGRMYVNANSWGWYIHLLRDVPWNRVPALKYILRTALGLPSRRVVSESWLRSQVSRTGFSVCQIASEGEGTFREESSSLDRPVPAYASTHGGWRSILEVLATKPES